MRGKIVAAVLAALMLVGAAVPAFGHDVDDRPSPPSHNQWGGHAGPGCGPRVELPNGRLGGGANVGRVVECADDIDLMRLLPESNRINDGTPAHGDFYDKRRTFRYWAPSTVGGWSGCVTRWVPADDWNSLTCRRV